MEQERGAQGDADAVARDVVARLEHAWNAGDGAAFGAPFAEDADFVDIRGEHHRGRGAIAGGHRAIFASVYQGSTVRYQVTQARAVADGVLLVHATGDLSAPAGPMAGEHRARQSLVLVRRGAPGGGWEVASFHNTLVAPPGRG
jgi:uncharacterized protein (TIGR02246 family)